MNSHLSIRSLSSLAAVAAVLSLLSQAALAAPMPISPITATASTEWISGGDTRTASDTVGGFNFTTGLSQGAGPVDPDTGLVFPIHDAFVGNMWLSNNEVPADITFNLGAAFNVDRVWIWNYDEGSNTRGATTTGDVSTSLNGVDFTPLLSSSNVALTIAPGAIDYDTPDVVDLGGTFAQYIRFSNLDNFPGSDDFVGLSEVIFFEADNVIPEPSTFLLAIMGLLGVAASGLRRRRRR